MDRIPMYVKFEYNNPNSMWHKTISIKENEDDTFTYKVESLNFDNPDICAEGPGIKEILSKEEALHIYNELSDNFDYTIVSIVG